MIQFMNMDNFIKNLTPVTTTEFFVRSGDFHPDGLFSEQIFGPLESPERKKTFSYINLTTKVIHPSALKILIQLDRKVEKFISTEESFSLNQESKLQIDNNGVTGLKSFIELFPKIKFRGDTDKRKKFIKKLDEAYKNKTLFIEFVSVIPPEQRPIYKDENDMWIHDKLNDYYVSLLRKTFHVRSASKEGPLFDLLNYEVQKAMIEHDDYIRTLIQKKRGLIRSQLLGKRTDFSGRAVITPGPDLKVNEVGVPLRLAVGLFEPFLIHRLLYSGYVNKKQLEKEIKDFLELELSVESVKTIIKSIKSDDKIPDSLRKIFFDATEVSMMGRAVIVKRDPCLQSESVRAYKPKLIEGNTMQMCTLQVGGHNADFDGDCTIISIGYKKNNENKICHISELKDKEKFIKHKEKTKIDGIKVTQYRPEEELTIQAIDIETGNIENKKILDYSIHENIKMYKIHDKKNRHEDFWSSYDHSLVIFDEFENKILKVTPRELIENPEGKYLMQRKENVK